MDIRPFRGLRFNVADFTKVIAPPYDVLTADDKQSLLAQDANNIVGIDLPHVPPVGQGPPEVYAQASASLARMREEGVLKRDSAPAIYAYVQAFEWQGRKYYRRAILTGVRATEFGKDVIPHEHTFAGPKADRLELTKQTRTQMSPIFGFYKDPTSTLKCFWESIQSRPADQQGRCREVEESLWVVSDEKLITKVTEALKDEKVFIADGHHRYTTAMNYRDSLLEEGTIDTDHEANFVLFALVERDDPGMLILPTHRILHKLSDSFSAQRFCDEVKGFKWTKLAGEKFDFGGSEELLGSYGPHSFAMVESGCESVWIAQLTDADLMLHARPQESQPWRDLDVAIVQELMLEEPMARYKTQDTSVEYTPDAGVVESRCKSGAVGFILRSTPIESIEAVALAGGAMPHKSTYFYPKLSTGVVLKPLE